MVNFWEQESLLHYDHIIVGAGIVGLSTAISLREIQPGCRVLVLERGLLPSGASTRNAGFACIGSPTELLECLETMDSAEVVGLVELRRKGLLGLRKRLGDSRIGYRENGSFELIPEQHLKALDQLDRLNDLLRPILGGNAFSVVNHMVHVAGFDPGFTKAMVQNHYEGELHTGKMMRALIEVAFSSGVEIKTGCTVENYEEIAGGVNVIVKGIHTHEAPVFTAATLLICTNGYTNSLIPGLDIRPGRGQVILTEPLSDIPFKGVYHFDRGYYYFREMEGRVLFGGGRQLDMTGETTVEYGPNESILKDLTQKLETIILPGKTIRIACSWSGIMAFGSSPVPLLKRYSEHVFLGVRLSGMGVAIGTELGRQLAAMAIQN